MHDTSLIYLLPMHDRKDSNQKPISAASRLKGFNCCGLSTLSLLLCDWSAESDGGGGGDQPSVTRCPGPEEPDAAGLDEVYMATTDF